ITNATVIIHDNDSSFQFSAPVYTVNRNSAAAAVTVTRLGANDTAASVVYNTANGTAVSGVDFTSVSGVLDFAAGQSSKTIIIPIIDDPAVQEPNRSFTVTLSNASGEGASLGAVATATVTLVNGPAVSGIELLSARGRVNRVERIRLSFVSPLDAAGASTVGNYILTARNSRDGRYNIGVR